MIQYDAEKLARSHLLFCTHGSQRIPSTTSGAKRRDLPLETQNSNLHHFFAVRYQILEVTTVSICEGIVPVVSVPMQQYGGRSVGDADWTNGVTRVLSNTTSLS